MWAMRLTSSALTGTSTGASSSSVRVRLRSGSCSTMTSLASINRRLQKVIVNPGAHRFGKERDELQKRFPAQMRLLAHCDFGGVGKSHPYRNLKSLAYLIHHRDRTVSPFRSPGNSQAITVQRMKRIENADVRGIRAQGIVGDSCFIRTCIASCPAAASPPTAPVGSPAPSTPSSFLIKSSAACSANSSC